MVRLDEVEVIPELGGVIAVDPRWRSQFFSGKTFWQDRGGELEPGGLPYSLVSDLGLLMRQSRRRNIASLLG